MNKPMTTEPQPTNATSLRHERGEVAQEVLTAGAFLAAIAIGIVAGNVEIHKPASPRTLNPEVISVSLMDDARLRTEAQVGAGDDLLAELNIPADKDGNPTELVVQTPDGVYEHTQDRDGLWIGIRAADIPASVANVQRDADDIVWVNHARATKGMNPADLSPELDTPTS